MTEGQREMTGVLPSSSTSTSSGIVRHHWPCEATPQATLLFQHGFGDYSQRWVRDYSGLLRDLHALKIDVWAIDMQGHGISAGKKSIVDVGQAVGEFVSLCRELVEPGRPPLIVLGHSLGGLVVAASAAKLPNAVAGVVLLAPALPDPMMPMLRRMVKVLAKLVPNWQIYRKKSDVNDLSRDPVAVRRWQNDLNCFQGQISYLLAASALDVAAELWSGREDWKIPLFLAHGDMDTYTEYQQSRKFVDGIRGCEVEFYQVPLGRHDLLSDTDAEETWSHVIQWIEKLLAD